MCVRWARYWFISHHIIFYTTNDEGYIIKRGGMKSRKDGCDIFSLERYELYLTKVAVFLIQTEMQKYAFSPPPFRNLLVSVVNVRNPMVYERILLIFLLISAFPAVLIPFTNSSLTLLQPSILLCSSPSHQ